MSKQSDNNRPTAGQLLTKYGSEVFEHPPSMTRSRLEEKLSQWDALDQHFTKTSLDFSAGMERRKVLDKRTRWLVQIGQFTATRSFGHLEDVLRAAISGGLAVREALEAILLCQVYAGDTAVTPALDVFTQVARDLGVLAGLRGNQLPLDGHDRERSLEAERKTWKAEEESDPRREALMQKYGWLGVSTGIRYRGVHHLSLLQHRMALDPEWAGLWLQFTYQRMYSRWILDDKTRVICTVGDTFAVGDFVQAHDHIVEALALGISPREIMEVVFLIGPYFGSPRMAASLKVLEGILSKQGRMAEIGDPPPVK